MKLLRCIICEGEIVIIDPNDRSINRKIKCKKCGFTNVNEQPRQKKEPEIIIIKKRG